LKLAVAKLTHRCSSFNRKQLLFHQRAIALVFPDEHSNALFGPSKLQPFCV